MTHTVLHIDASASGSTSASRAGSAQIVVDLAADKVIRRDVAADPLPFVDAGFVTSRMVAADDQTDADKAALALSDALVAELLTADTIVIGLPVYNFGMPASLKAWIDLVARPKVTFEYTATGPRGLLTGKKVIVVMASGGTAIDAANDYASTHLSYVLGFMGMTDVTVISAKDVGKSAAA